MTYLREIEKSLSLENFSQTAPSLPQSSLKEDSLRSSANESFAPDHSGADQTYRYSNRWSLTIKQKIYEMEGPTFFYQYLFVTSPSKEVSATENFSVSFVVLL